ncbi:MAG: aminofutalosine synthase MqnE [Sphingobacteriales bacterium]|jgi:aminodeoxyfutalosine synthase|nr:aminofutalosine synthase MqnE [Sphingobacteriales bacterium]
MEKIASMLLKGQGPELERIAEKVNSGLRISDEDALFLFEHAGLSECGILANHVREQKNGNFTFFNRNFHIEPTNVCVFTCNFCSYSREYKHREDGWELTAKEMLDKVKAYDGQPITEVHIVGGVHPKMDIVFFAHLLKSIKEHRPDLHIKAFTAVELDYMFRKAHYSALEGMRYLKEHGLDSIPGGGAEIFAAEIREKICADKCDADRWLEIHEAAHVEGLRSNATLLYGHIESPAHRVDHMRRLRELQDKTGGFQTFIPLKFRNKDNDMSSIGETTLIDDLKMFAIGRIYLDNFDHVKAYWPMIGRSTAQLTQAFGVDDLDGTIDDSTRIYTMAGSEEQTPALSTQELIDLIRGAGRVPVERDTLYNRLHVYEEAVTTQ